MLINLFPTVRYLISLIAGAGEIIECELERVVLNGALQCNKIPKEPEGFNVLFARVFIIFFMV